MPHPIMFAEDYLDFDRHEAEAEANSSLPMSDVDALDIAIDTVENAITDAGKQVDLHLQIQELTIKLVNTQTILFMAEADLTEARLLLTKLRSILDC